MDPVSRKDILDLILELKLNKNIITILSTHHLEEAEILSDNIIVLAFGKIKINGNVQEFKKQFGVGFKFEIFPKEFNHVDENYL